jgi:putative oxidoreductase
MTMEQMFSRYQPVALSLFRFITGLVLFQYGCAKILKIPAESMFKGVTIDSLYGAAGCIELVFGGLLILGLFTRPVAFILSGEMAFAYFISHAPHAFFPIINRGDAAILYCFIFLYIAFAGGGPWSLDAILSRKKPRSALRPAE